MRPEDIDAEAVRAALEFCARASRAASEAEVRDALSALSPEELARSRRISSQTPPAKPLGPHALADLARGVRADVAAARELGGYYALRAELSALKTIVTAKAPEPRPARTPAIDRSRHADDDAPEPPSALPSAPPLPRAPLPRETTSGPGEHELLTLFGYHRDPVLVAKALGLSLAALDARVKALHLSRKVAKAVATGMGEPAPRQAPTPGGNAVTVRKKAPGAPASRGPTADELVRAVRAEEAALGLVARKLRITGDELAALFASRGLAAQVEQLRENARVRERARKWPKERLEQLFAKAAYLRDLGVLEEIEADVDRHLRELMRRLSPKAADTAALVAAMARELKLDAARMRKLVDRFGLEPALRSITRG